MKLISGIVILAGAAALSAGTFARAQTSAFNKPVAQGAAPETTTSEATSDGRTASYRIVRGDYANHALIVRSSENDPDQEQNLEEDLAVMSRVLNKAVARQANDDQRYVSAMGINLVFSPGTGGFSVTYLEGYGALFVLKVNLPLLPPTSKPPAQTEEKPAEDSAWREAKQELYGNPSARQQTPAGEEFNEEKVERLKGALLEALKEASNVRGLKPEDIVTVCVLGAPEIPSAQVQQVNQLTAQFGGVPIVDQLRFPAAAPQVRTILTIRIKKSDADAVSHGKISADAFRKQAAVFAYRGAGGGLEQPGAGFVGTRGAGIGNLTE